MKIYILDEDPNKAAEYLADKYLGNYILLVTRYISNSVSNQTNCAIYKQFKTSDSLCKWIGESYSNTRWAYIYLKQMHHEYIKRFGKEHKCAMIIDNIKVELDCCTSWGLPREFPRRVASYRDEYIRKNLTWRLGNIPQWYKNGKMQEVWQF